MIENMLHGMLIATFLILFRFGCRIKHCGIWRLIIYMASLDRAWIAG